MASGLILVDIQNEYFPGGRMELTGIEQASVNAREVLTLFRDRGWPLSCPAPLEAGGCPSVHSWHLLRRDSQEGEAHLRRAGDPEALPQQFSPDAATRRVEGRRRGPLAFAVFMPFSWMVVTHRLKIAISEKTPLPTSRKRHRPGRQPPGPCILGSSFVLLSAAGQS
jgi:hypothetical protein